MRSIEKLSHFRCSSCGGWFSIGDAPARRRNWFCPWCGCRETHADFPSEKRADAPNESTSSNQPR